MDKANKYMGHIAYILYIDGCDSEVDISAVRRYVGTKGYGVTTKIQGGEYEVYTEHNFHLTSNMDIEYLDYLGYTITEIMVDNYKEVL